MSDSVPVVPEGRRRRRQHSEAFRAEVVRACCQPGVSTAAIAMANGLNANLVRRWVRDAETARPTAPTSTPAFVPVPLPASIPTADIRVEVRRGATTITVTWPSSAAAECAVWIRELLR